jgi:hypothetical protein
MSAFDSTKRLLPDILGDIVKGKIQLPDFQRGWVWDDEHVRSLLVSIARSFPVGAVMLLETGGEARFQVRPVENLPFARITSQAELLILDGQQRLTTLTQVLSLKGAETPGNRASLLLPHSHRTGRCRAVGRCADSSRARPQDEN